MTTGRRIMVPAGDHLLVGWLDYETRVTELYDTDGDIWTLHRIEPAGPWVLTDTNGNTAEGSVRRVIDEARLAGAEFLPWQS